MTAEFKIPDHDSNPLDNVEDILNANNWVFSRMNEDELVVNVTGKSGQYRLFFLWQEDMRALQFCVQHQINIQPNNMNTARNTVCKINENLWMGHFDLPLETHMPTYRYTCLFRGSPSSIPEIIEDMVDVSMSQCEKFFPVFQLLSGANDLGDSNLNLALMETAGES